MPTRPFRKPSWKRPWTARAFPLTSEIGQSVRPGGGQAVGGGPISPLLSPLDHHELPPEANPTGEELLDRSRQPFKVWVPETRALVIGHSQDAHRELRAEAVARDSITVLRRMGGGGAVLLSSGCVCVGLRYVRAKGLGIHDFFASAANYIRDVMTESFGIDLEMRGISDLAHSGPSGLRKVAGCSLYMPRDFALYLASILVRPDHGAFEAYLAHPSREPDYRGGRRHRDFIVGLEELAGRSLPPAEVAAALAAAVEDRLRLELDYPPEA